MKTIAVATALASALAAVKGFEVSFPNSNGGYWVTNYTNTLNWKANSSDPTYFSVQLLNSNNSQLNGNFQIGNALNTVNGSAQIFIDRIPSGSYTLLFVNSSNYELDHPQVYYASSTFEIKPNGTTPAEVTANTNADPSSTASKSATGSASATLVSATASSTAGSHSKANSASSVGVPGGFAAVCGTLVTLSLGLSLSLVA
ncbi:hypothetical protein ACQY0O_004578 [Thecaphora frezii]